MDVESINSKVMKRAGEIAENELMAAATCLNLYPEKCTDVLSDEEFSAWYRSSIQDRIFSAFAERYGKVACYSCHEDLGSPESLFEWEAMPYHGVCLIHLEETGKKRISPEDRPFYDRIKKTVFNASRPSI
jgi:hypothetical protein